MSRFEQLQKLAAEDSAEQFDGHQEAAWTMNPAIPIKRDTTTWKGGKSDLNCIAYNPTGTRIASASKDGTIRIWNAENGRELLVLHDHDEDPRCIAFSSDGQMLFSGGSGMKIRQWDGSEWDESLERKPMVLPGFNSRVVALAIKPDGTEIAAGGEDGFVKTWELPTGTPKETFTKHGNGDVVFDLAYEPDGRHVVSSGSGNDASVFSAAIRWSTDTGLDEFSIGHNREIFAVAIHPNDERFVLSGFDGILELYDTSSPDPFGTLGAHKETTDSLTFSPDGKHLVSASEHRTIRLWDASRWDGSQQGVIAYGCRGVSYCYPAFSPDSRQLVLGDGKDVVVLDIENWTSSIAFFRHRLWKSSERTANR